MKRQPPQEHSARVLAVALSIWAAGVAWASAAGVLSTISSDALAGLALFALVYAPATYLLDRRLRQFIQSMPGRSIAAAAVAIDAALAIAAVAMLGEPGGIAKLAQPAYAPAALFAAPVAAVLNLAWLERALSASSRLRRSPARSPGASPAST